MVKRDAPYNGLERDLEDKLRQELTQAGKRRGGSSARGMSVDREAAPREDKAGNTEYSGVANRRMVRHHYGDNTQDH